MVIPSMTQLVALVTQHKSSKGTNPYSSNIYTITPCYERNMSPIGSSYLGMFPRETRNENMNRFLTSY